MNGEIKEIRKELAKIKDRLTAIEEVVFKRKEKLPKEEIVNLKEGIKGLADKIKVSEEQIRKVFDFEDSTLTLIKTPQGENVREETQKAALAVLTGYKYCYNIENVLSIEIRRNLAENGISLNNFATYLNEITPSLIRRRGKPKSAKTTYRLTIPGDVEGRKVIKELVATKEK